MRQKRQTQRSQVKAQKRIKDNQLGNWRRHLKVNLFSLEIVGTIFWKGPSCAALKASVDAIQGYICLRDFLARLPIKVACLVIPNNTRHKLVSL